MSRVYLQAAALALVGLGLAVADRSMRPTPTVENAPGAVPPGGTPKAPATPDGKGVVAPAQPAGDSGKTPAAPPANPAGKPLTFPPATPPVTPPAPTPTGPVAVDPATLPTKIGLAPAYSLFESGASFIDGRKPDEYAAGHVRDAVNLRNEDVQQNNQAWQDFFQNANLEGSVYVVYCYGKDCHEADQLRDTLAAVGFKKVFVMEASFEEWKAAGHPAQ